MGVHRQLNRVWLVLFVRLAGTIILRISHGYRTKESNDYFVDLADQVMVQFSHGMRPNAFLVNFIPICKYFSTFKIHQEDGNAQ